MKKLKDVLVAAAITMLTAAPSVAAEADIPTDSLGDIVVFAAYEKFRIFSQVCGERAPEHKAEFDAVMAAFGERMKRLGAEVLASEELGDMTARVVPGSLVDAFARDFQNTLAIHRARQHSTEGCKAAHENFKAATDSHWRAGIAGALTESRETGKPFAPALPD